MMTYNHFDRWGNRGYHEETKTILNNIKHLKDISGLSYRKLSLELGFGPKSLSNYVCLVYRPNRERLDKIVEYFGIDKLDDLCMNEYKFKIKYPKMKEKEPV